MSNLNRKVTFDMRSDGVTHRLLSIAVLGIGSAFVLGCSSDLRTPKTNEQFELKQTKQGQIIRLNKETGEVDIIDAKTAPSARALGKSRSSTAMPTVTTTPKASLSTAKRAEP